MPQFSAKSQQSVLRTFSQKLHSALSGQSSLKESSIFARLVGLVWGYNMQLPQFLRLDTEQFPLPVIESLEHIMNPTIYKGSKKGSGYHLRNPKCDAMCPIKKVFSGSHGTYSGVWGTKTKPKTSTFFPDSWTIGDVQESMSAVLLNPVAVSLRTVELSDFDQVHAQEVEGMRLFGFGKDGVPTELIFNTETGFITTIYPILAYINFQKVLPLGDEIKVGKVHYNYSALKAAVEEAQRDSSMIRYMDDTSVIVDIAQTSLIENDNPGVPLSLRGIYVRIPKRSLGISTCSSGAATPMAISSMSFSPLAFIDR